MMSQDQGGGRVSAVAAVLSLAAAPSALAGEVSFQGLGDLPGGRFSSSALAVSADGTAVVGHSISANGNPEAFLWTESGGMIGLGDLPGGIFQSLAWEVSAGGSVAVGQGISSQGFAEAFRWTRTSGMTGLGFLPGGVGSIAFFTSADGSVVVGHAGNSSGRLEAFRWTQPGGMVGLGFLPGGIPESFPLDITPDGSVVVGNTYSAQSANRWVAFRWTPGGGVVGLGDLPGGSFESRAAAVSQDGAVVVGQSSSAGSGFSLEAFRWTQATGMVGLGFLPGGSSSSSVAVSADGSVVVGTSASTNGSEAFRWSQAGGMVGLGDLPGGLFQSFPVAVSSDGAWVIGMGCTDTFDLTCIFEPFLWDAAHGMQKLSDVLVDDFGLDLTGWTLGSVSDVSPDGQTIVGTGTNPSGDTEAWIATIPPIRSLMLDADPETVSASDPISFATAPGFPGRLAILVAVDINGTPMFLRAASGTFDASCQWLLSATVPPGLAGLVITFQSFGFDVFQNLAATNQETVTFQ